MELAKRLEQLQAAAIEFRKSGQAGKYPEEIRVEAVSLASEIGVRRLSTATGINFNTAYTWVTLAKKRKQQTKKTDSAKKNCDLPRTISASERISVTRVSLCSPKTGESTPTSCLARLCIQNGTNVEIFDADLAIRLVSTLQCGVSQ